MTSTVAISVTVTVDVSGGGGISVVAGDRPGSDVFVNFRPAALVHIKGILVVGGAIVVKRGSAGLPRSGVLDGGATVTISVLRSEC